MNEGNETLTNRRYSKILGFLLLLIVISGFTFGQTPVNETVRPKPAPKTQAAPQECRGCSEGEKRTSSDNNLEIQKSELPFEKSIEVDGEVIINFCVSAGSIKVNGWNRNEVRVFVSQGGKAGFRPLGKNEFGKPTKVTILGYDPTQDRGAETRQCLSGESIEIDAPTGANVSGLDGREGSVTVAVESIANATVRINSGDIAFRGIAEGIEARTYDGDISVEDSTGKIELSAVDGNILVYNAKPRNDWDVLSAKTNSGSVTLQESRHSVVSATSLSGLIKFVGEIQLDGQYTFKNTQGQILLDIPGASSCTVQVFSQKDKLVFDVPLEMVTEEFYPGAMQKIVGVLGKGEAVVKIDNQAGRIIIKKKN